MEVHLHAEIIRQTGGLATIIANIRIFHYYSSVKEGLEYPDMWESVNCNVG